MSGVYRGMDAPALERAYQPAFTVPDLGAVLRGYAERGAVARDAVPHHRIAYGDHPDEWLWYVPAPGPHAPLVAFLHGGYWRRLSADDGCLLAPGAHAAGYAFASVNYTLCPAAPLERLVEQSARAAAFLRSPSLGHDPGRVHLAGHSAGAHLAAMVALADGHLAGLVLVSGVYDLAPIVFTTINDDVRLRPADAARLSPMAHLDGHWHRAGAVVAWSERDTAEFARQSRDLAAVWSATPGNRPPAVLEVAGRHHFDVIDELFDPSRPLGAAVAALVGPAGRPG
ncbi:MAG: alpha/beta hydrolase [Acidimicrobiales bacterium]